MHNQQLHQSRALYYCFFSIKSVKLDLSILVEYNFSIRGYFSHFTWDMRIIPRKLHSRELSSMFEQQSNRPHLCSFLDKICKIYKYVDYIVFGVKDGFENAILTCFTSSRWLLSIVMISGDIGNSIHSAHVLFPTQIQIITHSLRKGSNRLHVCMVKYGYNSTKSEICQFN